MLLVSRSMRLILRPLTLNSMRITTESTLTTLISHPPLILIRYQLRTSLDPAPRHLLGGRRNPLGALPGLDSLEVHGINLLEGPALTFNDEEVDDESSDSVAPSEHVTVAEVSGFGDERCEEGEELHRVSLIVVPSKDEQDLQSSRASY